MKTWMTYGFDKIVADKSAPSDLKKAFNLFLTKGCNGNCQIVVNSDIDTSVTLKTVSCDGVKCEIFTADHVLTINDHQYTDPLVPYCGDAITVRAAFRSRSSLISRRRMQVTILRPSSLPKTEIPRRLLYLFTFGTSLFPKTRPSQLPFGLPRDILTSSTAI